MKAERGTWAFRRRLVKASLGFCAFVILWVMMVGAVDVETGKTIVASAFALSTSIIVVYTGAATYNDKVNKE